MKLSDTWCQKCSLTKKINAHIKQLISILKACMRLQILSQNRHSFYHLFFLLQVAFRQKDLQPAVQEMCHSNGHVRTLTKASEPSALVHPSSSFPCNP